MERRLAAILATDVVGYSRLIGIDEEGTIAALQALHAEQIEPLVAGHKGRIFKLMGDGMLAEFPSVVDAVRAAVALQEALAAHNAALPEDKRIALRAGVNLGDVVVEGDDIHGDGVNIAARLEGLAPPGGLCISAGVHEQVRDRLGLGFEDLGEKVVKNIVRPVRVWQWRPGAGDAEADVPSPAPADKPSIAVLPFDNMSSDPEQGYFSDGITEDIITEVSRIPEVMVISRNSSFTYRGKAAKVQEVCRDLGVRYVLEGSVRKAGARVRITAQLIDGQSGAPLWAERYDRGLEDIFAVQDDVTEQIVRALEVKLVGSLESLEARQPTQNPEAYDCVLRGREQYRLFTREGNAAARRLFERAVALDPGYGEPYAGLAETYVQDWFMGEESTLERAFALAQEATQRDPALPLVQEALSTVHLFSRQHEAAIATARRWIELEPSNAEAYATLAGALHFAGTNEEIVALVETAMRLNPHYPFYYPHYIGLAHLGLRRVDAAVAAFERAAARSPEALWPHVFLAACHGHQGKSDEASAQRAEVLRINPAFSVASLFKLLPYKNPADADLLTDGLGKAGFEV
ncbi:MAG: adenylate/guanylate cyclase domain-containing protein [Pseudomonadota bacterium]